MSPDNNLEQLSSKELHDLAVSHARRHVNHLADGPEQRARDAALAGSDPLVANGWIYGPDAESVR